MPELVYEAPQGPNPAIELPGNTSKALYYQRFVVPLVKAVQELKTLFDGLAVKMEKLIAEVTGHGEAIRKLEARVGALTGENDALRRGLDELRKAFEASKAAPRADNDNAPAMPRAANENEPIATKRMMKAAGMDRSALGRHPLLIVGATRVETRLRALRKAAKRASSLRGASAGSACSVTRKRPQPGQSMTSPR